MSEVEKNEIDGETVVPEENGTTEVDANAEVANKKTENNKKNKKKKPKKPSPS